MQSFLLQSICSSRGYFCDAMSAQTQSRRGSETFEQAGRQSQCGRSCAIQDGLVSPEQTESRRTKGPGEKSMASGIRDSMWP